MLKDESITSLFCELYHAIKQCCKFRAAQKLLWLQVAMVTSCYGYKLLVTSCYGYKLPWIQVAMVTSCCGKKTPNFSTFQKNTWGDLLEKLLPKSLCVAMEEDKNFREGLPLNYSSYMGVSKSDVIDSQRSEFMVKVRGMLVTTVSATSLSKG